MRSTVELDAQLAELLAGCSQRNQQALEQLYRLAGPTLLGCLMKILRRRALAEEALQDVFVQVWERAAQYEQHRGRPYAWLVSIARYRAIDILRRERAENTDPFEMAESLESSPAAEDSQPIGLNESRALELCLGRLAAEQRDSIRLAFVSGRSHQEIASSLNRPLGSVKSWIRRGLITLKECIEACGPRTTN